MKYLKFALLFLIAGLLFSDGLTDEEKALFKTNVVVPVPSEIIMALDMLSETNWKAVVEYDYSANYSDYHKIALNLGVRVAQGFIAIQAQDRRNTGEMFSVSRDLAENFGAKSEMFVDRDEIARLLNAGEWLELRAILDDIHLKVKDEMIKYDPDYVTLAGVGGWIEGLHIVSKALKANYTEEASTILYQPELINHFIEKVGQLKQSNADNEEVKAIKEKLPVIRDLCAVGQGNPISIDSIDSLYSISSSLNSIIVAAQPENDQIAEESPQRWMLIYSVIFIALLILYVSRRKKGGK
jgi:hypothetical protein